ncbi:MAG: N-acetyltransferase [Pseudonocardiales bacterium]|nr:N-acetyltransferase [Pseudonocardiales bacterium]
MILRREHGADRDAIFAVHTAAFGRPDGGGGGDVPEARLVDALRDDGNIVAGLSVVATLDAAVVGHVVCSRATAGDHPVLGLGPLGVVPEFQRRGVGSALMYAVLAAADALDESAVVLLGDPGYYCRFGFEPADSLGLGAPDPAWGVHFQVRPMSAWDPSVRGSVRYASAFDRL